MYPTVLSSEHFSATKQATSNILSSDLALETYAQVVNGLPVPTTFEKAQGDIWWHADNPNPEPSKEAYHEVELFRNSFNIAQIKVDVKVCDKTSLFESDMLTRVIYSSTISKRTARLRCLSSTITRTRRRYLPCYRSAPLQFKTGWATQANNR